MGNEVNVRLSSAEERMRKSFPFSQWLSNFAMHPILSSLPPRSAALLFFVLRGFAGFLTSRFIRRSRLLTNKRFTLRGSAMVSHHLCTSRHNLHFRSNSCSILNNFFKDLLLFDLEFCFLGIDQ